MEGRSYGGKGEEREGLEGGREGEGREIEGGKEGGKKRGTCRKQISSSINVISLPVLLLCVSRPHSSSRNGTAVDLSTQTLPSTTSHQSTSCLDPAVKRVIFIHLECSAMLCTMEVDHCAVVSTTCCLLNRMWKL